MNSEKTSRRGFLKFLGKGSAAGAVLVGSPMAGYAIGIDVSSKTEDHTALNFTCECGQHVMAIVPNNSGDVVNAPCARCGKDWRLQWNGDHFSTFIGEPVPVKVKDRQAEADQSMKVTLGPDGKPTRYL